MEFKVHNTASKANPVFTGTKEECWEYINKKIADPVTGCILWSKEEGDTITVAPLIF